MIKVTVPKDRKEIEKQIRGLRYLLFKDKDHNLDDADRNYLEYLFSEYKRLSTKAKQEAWTAEEILRREG